MKKFRVAVPFIVWVDVDVKAEDKDEAIEAATQEAFLTNYAGNGSTTNLIGNDISGSVIEAGEEFIEIELDGYSIKPEIIKEYDND